MKKIILPLLFLFALQVSAQNDNPKYDRELAEKLGGDEYGMKSYVLVMLKTGSNKSADKEFINKAFQGHMENMGKLVKEGKLIVAGPFQKNDKDYRGIFILNVKTIDQAKEWINTDPAVQEKLLEVEFYGWYGSAALPTYLETHEKIERQKH